MTSLLITHPDLSFYGGAELVITELCRYLGNHGIPHDVLTRAVSDEVKMLTPKTNYITISPSWQGRWQTGTAYAFWRYLKEHPDWDVVNAHNYPTHLAAAGCSIPTVWMCNEPPSFHIHYNGVKRPVDLFKIALLTADRWMVRNRVDDIIVADEFNQQRFSKLYSRPSHIIPYGIDYAYFSSGEGKRAVESYHLEDRFVLLHVGVFSPLKNQMASVRCLKKIIRTDPSGILILAGQGGNWYEEEVRAYIRAHHLEKHVLITGHISRNTIRDLYHAAHLALFPVQSQGSWLSPFEALCAGTPVIVSPDITSSSLISMHEIGTVTRDYVQAVQTIMQNYNDYATQAERGRRWVRDNLKWEKFCRELFERCEAVVRT
ncbi:glycosyltransferase family 4 protein [Methanospirillum stamsii]|uniref:Uncharacterized protein n=1 Tax=Methanospirillum stamsii TaxID=1277351 RepID=A0A2V2MXQ5_9EURY|nr:glycosyltransferase family 4 protein [Methanospirillum stamsii]PWR72914.1 hypothetical protein DLD82_11640 [Methanospirillum stamsii]